MKLKFECWNVAFRRHEEDILRNDDKFVVIPNTLRYWAADPFIVYEDNVYYIFAELYDRLLSKGKIGYCKLSNDGKLLSKWKVLIDSSTHMSFPVPIKYNGKYYLMPESSKEYELRIYSAESFPEKWIKCKTLLTNVQVADSIFVDKDTLLTYDNYSVPKKALLYKRKKDNSFICVEKEEDTELRLRPAGKTFFSNGMRIAPLQNCNGAYGKSVFFTALGDHINDYKIIGELSDKTLKINDYNEVIEGIHTYNFCNDFEVIDIKTRKFNLINFFGLLIRKIHKYKKG